MKSRGKSIRIVKNPKTIFYNRLEPLSRERALEAHKEGEYKYKQAITRKGGGKFKKGTKF